jgi:CHAD domain-containing protein
LIALIRPALSRDDYDSINTGLRDIGRALAGQRDHAVMRMTLEVISTDVADGKGAEAIQRAQAILDKQAVSEPSAGVDHDGVLGDLNTVTKLISALRLGHLQPDHLCQGAGRTYAKARRGLGLTAADENQADRHAEDLHEWRKTVQRHWRHVQMLAPVWPAAMAARVEDARAISQLLGEHNDLAVLRRFISSKHNRIKRQDRIVILGLIDARQTGLRERPFWLASRLFSASRPDFERDVRQYWNSASNLTGTAR